MMMMMKCLRVPYMSKCTTVSLAKKKNKLKLQIYNTMLVTL